MIFSDITRCMSQSKENWLTWGAHLSAAAGGGRGVRGHLWWAWAFTNEKNILPDAVLNFMFWRVKNEMCFHLINKTWCIWFAMWGLKQVTEAKCSTLVFPGERLRVHQQCKWKSMPQEQEIVGVQMKEGGNASHTPGGWWMERRGLLDALKAWTGIQRVR